VSGRRRPAGPRRGESGAALVEFALVGSLVILILFAVVELGMLVNARLVLAAAAREGVRRAAVEGGDTARVRQRIAEELRLGGIDADQVNVTIRPRNATYGTTVTVRLEYGYRLVTPILREVVGGLVPLAAEVSARSERVRPP